MSARFEPIYRSDDHQTTVYRAVCNPFAENTYVLAHAPTGKAWLFDPGMDSPSEQRALTDLLATEKLSLAYIYLTHSHIDHVLGLAWAVGALEVDYAQTSQDEDQLRATAVYAPAYGFTKYSLPSRRAAKILTGGQHIELAAGVLMKVLDTPGHAPGHVSFYFPDLGCCLSGDALFRESIGRTDLPGGHAPTLERSIREKLYALPGDTLVLPGHMDATTIDHERAHNPFVRM